MPKPSPNRPKKPLGKFVDVFAGCGGMSLGLASAGWEGVFAIERQPEAFASLNYNLIDGKRTAFSWPGWLPKRAMTTDTLIRRYAKGLAGLRGDIDLLVGGPPCQGFSMAGRRTHADPRNRLVNDYIRIVRTLRPRFLIIENVKGFSLPFKKKGNRQLRNTPYSVRVKSRLEKLGYRVFSKLVDLSDYGIPQTRLRYILIAIQDGDRALKRFEETTPFDLLAKMRKELLAQKGLPTDRAMTAREAIGDLETFQRPLVVADGGKSIGFKEIEARGTFSSPLIKSLRAHARGKPDSLRLANHKPEIRKRFELILSTCPKGTTLSDADRKRLGIKKHSLTPLSAKRPSATVTTLPEDMLHYSEPRILTVRENARLQTFPDWYAFQGAYTTGSMRRRITSPRYTQVGNAVPPLFAELLGKLISSISRGG